VPRGGDLDDGCLEHNSPDDSGHLADVIDSGFVDGYSIAAATSTRRLDSQSIGRSYDCSSTSIPLQFDRATTIRRYVLPVLGCYTAA